MAIYLSKWLDPDYKGDCPVSVKMAIDILTKVPEEYQDTILICDYDMMDKMILGMEFNEETKQIEIWHE